MCDMKIALIANSIIENDDFIKQKLDTFDLVYAVDRGLHHLDRMGISPSLVIGDFDSLDPRLLKKYSSTKTIQLQKDKDITDLEAAIFEALKLNPSEIVGYGCFGGRIDHEIANLILLAKYETFLRFESKTQTCFVKSRDFTLRVKKSQTLSFFPFLSNVTHLSTSGLKWDLENQTLSDQFVSISNICSEEVIEFRFNSGKLLVVLIAKEETL